MIRKIESAERPELVSDEYLYVNECGVERDYSLDSNMIRPNGRPDYQIIYIARGFCYVKTDGHYLQCGAGTVILFKPYELQDYYYLVKDNPVGYWVHFSGIGCERLIEELRLGEVRIFDMGISPKCEEIMVRMIHEFRLKLSFYEGCVAGCLAELLSYIARQHQLREKRITPTNERLVGDACMWIQDNYDRDIGVTELAKESGLSFGRFSNIFKQIIGKTPHEYLIDTRISAACELLSTSSLSMLEICELVGMQDRSYFSRIFKKRCGCTPTEWRNRRS